MTQANMRTQRAKSVFKAATRRILGAIEKRVLPVVGKQRSYAPIIIIAPPRSGSTLLYQLISARFGVCYFENYMMHVPEAPVSLALLLSPFLRRQPKIDFQSAYGVTPGRRGPAQGYEVWNRWFPSDVDWVPAGVLEHDRLLEMQRTIHGLQKINKAPFVNKWQRHSMRIGALAEAFPDCIFVTLKRDPAHMTLSILKGRRRHLGDENEWLSARPRACGNIGDLSPIDQVCAQVHYLGEEIEEAFRSFGTARVIDVRYEDLCVNPEGELSKIRRFYEKTSGRPLVDRGKVPETFIFGESDKDHDQELLKIRDQLQRLRTCASI